MTDPGAKKASTTVLRTIYAPREVIYRAFLDPAALALWRSPANMTARVHAFEPRECGTYRMSLTYLDAKDSPGGKTDEDTDTFQGTFLELVPNKKIVELITFETRDPRFAGQMKMTSTFTETVEGTQVTILCENLPEGIRPEDNELGCRSSLQNLARLVEKTSK
jgi:uncharacterized protein YndB with AHSA1/START domain